MVINAIVGLALRRADIPARLEPTNLMRDDSRMMAPLVTRTWKVLTLGLTCKDMLAPSHIHKSSLATGSAALETEIRESTKYTALRVAHTFVPVAAETFGAWDPEAILFLSELGRRISTVTGKVRSTVYLRQRIDIALQRGNSASVLGTLNPPLPYDRF